MLPVRDRNLLQELVRKFGWACVFYNRSGYEQHSDLKIESDRSKSYRLEIR